MNLIQVDALVVKTNSRIDTHIAVVNLGDELGTQRLEGVFLRQNNFQQKYATLVWTADISRTLRRIEYDRT